MSRKGPKVGQEMLDFVEDCCKGVDIIKSSTFGENNLVIFVCWFM